MNNLEVKILKTASDNLIFLIHDVKTGLTASIDACEAKPTLDFIYENDWHLTHILTTHHHADHINSNRELKRRTGCAIYGFEGDKNRIPEIDILLKDEQIILFGNHKIRVIHTPGHTTGSICYYIESAKAVFVGDTLFSSGCGKLFEGTAEQLFNSINKILTLPEDTNIYCGHEYSHGNTRFALTLEPNNKDLLDRYAQIADLLEAGKPTAPTTISLERKINPFLRTGNQKLRHNLNMLGSSPLEVFTEIRNRRDSF